MTEMIGWLSSLVLIVTLVKQNWKQWSSGSVEGVSRWLWIGQTVSSPSPRQSQLSRLWSALAKPSRSPGRRTPAQSSSSSPSSKPCTENVAASNGSA